MQQKKTVDEIKEMYPGLELRADAHFHTVGYPEPGDLFHVQGTGESIDEAWNDAYECLTNTGKYSKEKKDIVPCKISMDKTPDSEYWLYIHDYNDMMACSVQVIEVTALRLAKALKLNIKKFPF